MTGLCAEFGISRKTGYKIYSRYKGTGCRGWRTAVDDRNAMRTGCRWRSRRLIVRLKRKYPSWGAPEDPREVAPAVRAAAVSGDQHGARRTRSPRPGAAPRRARPRSTGTPLQA